MRSGLPKGNGRRSTALTTLKTVVALPIVSASRATTVRDNAGALRTRRHAYPVSCTESSKSLVPRASRLCSRTPASPPNASLARRHASSGARPRRSSVSASRARCASISSSNSRSSELPRRSARNRYRSSCHHSASMSPSVWCSTHVEHEGDRRRQTRPVTSTLGQLLPSQPRELVVFSLAIVLGNAPGRLDPAASFETVQCGIERALGYLQRFARDLAETLEDGPSVHRAKGESLENQEIEGSLRQVEASAHVRF